MSSDIQRLIFLGSPQFASLILDELVQSNEQYEVVAVITESDKPAGRGQKLTPTSVKTTAIKHNIELLQPETLRGIKLSDKNQLIATKDSNRDFVDRLNSLAPIDAMITVAYGKIIPRSILAYPRVAIINVHASLLPRWRGAAPIHRALFSGDSKTGISIMKTVYELDEGPVYCSEEIEISTEDDFGTLHDKLADCAVRTLLGSLPKILQAELEAKEQPSEGVTYADKWMKGDFSINWHDAAEVTQRRIRTCAPSPGARTNLNGELLKIFSASIKEDQNYPAAAKPGEVVEVNRAELVIATGSDKFLSIEQMQFPGRKKLPVSEVLKSKKIELGEVFQSPN